SRVTRTGTSPAVQPRWDVVPEKSSVTRPRHVHVPANSSRCSHANTSAEVYAAAGNIRLSPNGFSASVTSTSGAVIVHQPIPCGRGEASGRGAPRGDPSRRRRRGQRKGL